MSRADLRRATRERLALSVAESEARHRALLAALPSGALLQSADGTVLLANPRARDLLGIGDPEEIPAPHGAVPAPRRPDHPDQTDQIGQMDHVDRTESDKLTPLEQVSRVTAAAIRTGETQTAVVVPITHDGQRTLLTVTAVPLLDDDGGPQAVVSSVSAAADLAGHRRSTQMFRQAMQFSPIGVGVTALNGRFLRVNRTLCRMLGYRADELQERTLFQILHPDDLEEASLQIGDLLRGDIEAVTLDRRYIGQGEMSLQGPLSVVLIRDSQDRPLQFVVQIQDTSEVQRAQELLTHLTLHDPLTGLANRTLLLDQLQKALDRSRRGGHRVAVLQCDVDHFMTINHSAGYDQGDSLLVELGQRVGESLRPGDTAGRLGGDEFVVICDAVTDEDEAIAAAERLQSSLRTAVDLGGRTVTPTVSIGIAISDSPEADPQELLRDAGIATQRAKGRGRDRWDLVDPTLRRDTLDRLSLEQELRIGISAGELELHFQPIVDVGTREIVGREALVRWNHPERGQLAPMLFLPVAEESGLILELGRWVLATATRAAAAAPGSTGYVAVNVSANQVASPGLAEAVEQTLAESGLPPERLVIELTESVMLSTAPSAGQEIERLDDLGVRIVVDDFGTGFSALSYLRDLPVSGIKVDRSFTAGLGTDPQCERIVEALTGLGHGLGVDVIVEGVETEEQREMLASIGTEHAQGYLFGRPAPGFDLALQA